MSDVKKYQDLLEKVDTMAMEEVLIAQEEIKDDVKKMNDAKTVEEKKQKELAKKAAEKKVEKYKYPFIIHIAGKNVETDHIFEDNKEYTNEEIRTKMLEHQFYDFSGKVSFEYLEKDNVLLPIFQQHKKG